MSAVRIAAVTSGLGATQDRLRGLAAPARAAVAEVLRAAADEVAGALREALPARSTDAVRVEDDDGASLLVVDVPDASAREFGTSRTAARPLLRPLAAEAADRAGPEIAAAFRGAVRDGGRR